MIANLSDVDLHFIEIGRDDGGGGGEMGGRGGVSTESIGDNSSTM